MITFKIPAEQITLNDIAIINSDIKINEFFDNIPNTLTFSFLADREININPISKLVTSDSKGEEIWYILDCQIDQCGVNSFLHSVVAIEPIGKLQFIPCDALAITQPSIQTRTNLIPAYNYQSKLDNYTPYSWEYRDGYYNLYGVLMKALQGTNIRVRTDVTEKLTKVISPEFTFEGSNLLEIVYLIFSYVNIKPDIVESGDYEELIIKQIDTSPLDASRLNLALSSKLTSSNAVSKFIGVTQSTFTCNEALAKWVRYNDIKDLIGDYEMAGNYLIQLQNPISGILCLPIYDYIWGAQEGMTDWYYAFDMAPYIYEKSYWDQLPTEQKGKFGYFVKGGNYVFNLAGVFANWKPANYSGTGALSPDIAIGGTMQIRDLSYIAIRTCALTSFTGDKGFTKYIQHNTGLTDIKSSHNLMNINAMKTSSKDIYLSGNITNRNELKIGMTYDIGDVKFFINQLQFTFLGDISVIAYLSKYNVDVLDPIITSKFTQSYNVELEPKLVVRHFNKNRKLRLSHKSIPLQDVSKCPEISRSLMVHLLKNLLVTRINIFKGDLTVGGSTPFNYKRYYKKSNDLSSKFILTSPNKPRVDGQVADINFIDTRTYCTPINNALLLGYYFNLPKKEKGDTYTYFDTGYLDNARVIFKRTDEDAILDEGDLFFIRKDPRELLSFTYTYFIEPEENIFVDSTLFDNNILTNDITPYVSSNFLSYIYGFKNELPKTALGRSPAVFNGDLLLSLTGEDSDVNLIISEVGEAFKIGATANSLDGTDYKCWALVKDSKIVLISNKGDYTDREWYSVFFQFTEREENM